MESTEGTRARGVVPSRATERRSRGEALLAPLGDRRTAHAAVLSPATRWRRSEGPLRSIRCARWMMRSRMASPEDHRRDIAGLGRREQKAGDRRIGLRYAAIELITEALAQRLRGAADDFGDIVLRDTETGQVPHLLAQRIIDDKGCSRHVQLLI